MLARTVGPKFNQYPCFVQPKLNGVRALFQKAAAPGRAAGVFQSRDEKLWRTEVLQHLHDELSRIDVGDLILDGELYKHGWRLQDINGAVAINRLQPREDTHEVCFHVFDVVNLTDTFSDRYLDLFRLLKDANLPHIQPVECAYANSWEMVKQFFHHWTAQGYEGIMLRPAGKYEFGEHLSQRTNNMTEWRSRSLWKHKQWEDDEFVCVGVTQGEGKAEIGVGALICETNNPSGIPGRGIDTFGIGTGLTDKDRISFAQNPPIGQMIKVRYLCLTADGIPFNPSFLCVMS